MKVTTCSAPTNIAVIKYWGKDNVALNTPINSSVSVTLHQDQLRTTTSVAGDSALQATRLWLNGQEQPINKRVAVVLREMRELAQRVHGESKSQHLHIVSTNSFPTAAGLASSAAGYACLVAALAEFYGISKADEEFPGQLSAIARQGSGSACRSPASPLHSSMRAF
ncbi:diphosphomevalonate decarboxylase [Phytophthora nicotianae INRA-310]|uniref:Diphosphomevalonate decarboxylase n=1 Tax=Phytophthora nicotianae (strain INRA-310) TaxID=761204 RepID=W2PHI1_PHYN3|nr:diphosphomevalonate decarboxylase [Phytophthora nicotianae INRA-310]ETN00116.1 diphosphomevalonate decarboxylase [Phytophthora nicotianae INRA-310]